jgi:hypothetical protein
MAKYRVQLDLSFDSKADADSLENFAKTLISKAKNINEGEANEETSTIHSHKCMHDEGKACAAEVLTEAPRVKPKKVK